MRAMMSDRTARSWRTDWRALEVEALSEARHVLKVTESGSGGMTMRLPVRGSATGLFNGEALALADALAAFVGGSELQ